MKSSFGSFTVVNMNWLLKNSCNMILIYSIYRSHNPVLLTSFMTNHMMFLSRETRLAQLVEQKPLTLPDHLGSPMVFIFLWKPCCSVLSFLGTVLSPISCPFLCWPLQCMPFNLQPLLSSNSFYT